MSATSPSSCGQPVQDPPADLAVHQLAAAEDHGALDLVAVLEEPLGVAPLELEVVLVDLGAELHLLDLDVPLVLARLRLPLGLLVEELSRVHDPADGRGGGGRDLHEVEALLLGEHEGLGRGHDPELAAVLVDDTDLLGADAVVDADRLAVYWTPPAVAGGTSSTSARSEASLAIFAPSGLHVARTEVTAVAVAHGDALPRDLLVPHHEHVGDLLDLGLADLVVHLLAALVDVHADALRPQRVRPPRARSPGAAPRRA